MQARILMPRPNCPSGRQGGTTRLPGFSRPAGGCPSPTRACHFSPEQRPDGGRGAPDPPGLTVTSRAKTPPPTTHPVPAGGDTRGCRRTPDTGTSAERWRRACRPGSRAGVTSLYAPGPASSVCAEAFRRIRALSYGWRTGVERRPRETCLREEIALGSLGAGSELPHVSRTRAITRRCWPGTGRFPGAQLALRSGARRGPFATFGPPSASRHWPPARSAAPSPGKLRRPERATRPRSRALPHGRKAPPRAVSCRCGPPLSWRASLKRLYFTDTVTLRTWPKRPAPSPELKAARGGLSGDLVRRGREPVGAPAPRAG